MRDRGLYRISDYTRSRELYGGGPVKLFIKILLLLIVVALGSLFFLEDEKGEPLMTVSDLKKSDMGLGGVVERLPAVKNPVTDKPIIEQKEDKPPEKTKIYSWKDDQGNVHFTNEPPPDKKQAKLIQVNPNINVMPAVKRAEEDQAAE